MFVDRKNQKMFIFVPLAWELHQSVRAGDSIQRHEVRQSPLDPDQAQSAY
jgi:hypothetical protein